MGSVFSLRDDYMAKSVRREEEKGRKKSYPQRFSMRQSAHYIGIQGLIHNSVFVDNL